jgi:acyl-CoA synthetase (NDP forming)
MTDLGQIADTILEVYLAHKQLGKPFVMECQGGDECVDAILKFRDAGVPAYYTAEQGVNALVALR